MSTEYRILSNNDLSFIDLSFMFQHVILHEMWIFRNSPTINDTDFCPEINEKKLKVAFH